MPGYPCMPRRKVKSKPLPKGLLKLLSRAKA
jgi:hypothetical protein